VFVERGAPTLDMGRPRTGEIRIPSPRTGEIRLPKKEDTP